MRALVFLVALALLPHIFSSCRLSFKAAKVCRHFRYSDGTCIKGFESKCKPVKVTFNEPRCPIYVGCQVISYIPSVLS